MRKVILFVFVICLCFALVACGQLSVGEAAVVVSEAITASNAADYTAHFTVDYSALSGSEVGVFNTTIFDTVSVDYEYRHTAADGSVYQKSTEESVVTEEWFTYGSAPSHRKTVGGVITEDFNTNGAIIADAYATFFALTEEQQESVVAMRRSFGDVVRYYTETTELVDESQPYRKLLDEENNEYEYYWNNIRVMHTQLINFTITDGKIVLLEIYSEKVEQFDDPISIISTDKVGVVTEKSMATIEIIYQ